MKMFYTIIILALNVFFSCQSIPQEKDPLNETAQGYIADFDEFKNNLITVHPATYEFTSERVFLDRTNQLRQEIDNNTTDQEFIWILGEVIAMIGCGHTSLGFFNQQRALLQPNEYFPLQTRWINNRLYVTETLINKDKVKVGEEILKINGQPVSQIMDDIYKHINSQAHWETPRNMLFNGYNTSLLPYGLGFPKNYAIHVKSNPSSISLSQLSNNPPYAPLYSKKHPCQKDFCLNMLGNKTALLTIRNYAYFGDRNKVYREFLNESFESIKANNVNKLIIDVRGNLGGPAISAISLLRHTLSSPFAYFAEGGSDFHDQELINPFENNFKGSIAFVMNGEGGSSVGHLASIYKDKGRVHFIGETLGGNQFCTANQKQYELPNTKIQYTVARNRFLTNVKEQDPKSRIDPDVYVVQSIDEFLNDQDVVLEKAIEILND